MWEYFIMVVPYYGFNFHFPDKDINYITGNVLSGYQFLKSNSNFDAKSELSSAVETKFPWTSGLN